MEMRAEVILKGTKVDGIYTADPMIDKTATRYDSISYLEVLERAPEGHGRDGDFSLHGQQAADHRLQPASAGQFAPRHHGRTGRHDRDGLKTFMDANDLKSLSAEIKKRMDGTIEHVRKELGGLRTGRASVSLLDPVQVEAYGTMMPLNQVASLSVPEPSAHRRAAVRPVAAWRHRHARSRRATSA